MRNIYIFLLWVILFVGILCFNFYFPFLQSRIARLNAPVPGGAFVTTNWPTFDNKQWFKGKYQQQYELAYKQQHHSSPFMLRQRNQFLWQQFGDMGNEKIILGHNNYLFSKDYTEALLGRDYLGKNTIDSVITQLEKVHQLLAEKGKEFLVLMPPGQARAQAQYLPAFYENFADSTNWDVFSDKLKQSNISFFNFEELLIPQAPETYQYYPQLGLHWNMYGATTAMTEIDQYIQEKTDFKLPQITYSLSKEGNKVQTDLDLFFGANLLYQIPKHHFPIPTINYTSDSTTLLPNVLIIGDSFYELLYKQKAHKALFAPESSFWYYNSEIYPQGGHAYQRNLKQEIEDRDIVILLAAEWNLVRVGWGFLEQVLATSTDNQ